LITCRNLNKINISDIQNLDTKKNEYQNIKINFFAGKFPISLFKDVLDIVSDINFNKMNSTDVINKDKLPFKPVATSNQKINEKDLIFFANNYKAYKEYSFILD
jgi:hypothetical protein